MPKTTHIDILVNGKKADVSSIEDLPIAISMNIEDENNFQSKKSQEVISYEFPATQTNSQIFESFEVPEAEQLTANSFIPIIVTAGGDELLKGKLLLKSASSINGNPTSYNTDMYGSSGDWLIDLADKTLIDFINPNTHYLKKDVIIDSWAFDGLSEIKDYVYAPVRYRRQFNENDMNLSVQDFRPSISKYWILYRAFKSLGYKIESAFLDSNFFRRQVMPWVWGDFGLINEKRLEFKTTGTPRNPPPPNPYYEGISRFVINPAYSTDGYFIIGITPVIPVTSFINNWDMAHDIPPLGFDNGVSGLHPLGNYTYGSGNMKWEYLSDVGAELGAIDATFKLTYSCLLPIGGAIERKMLQCRVYYPGGTLNITLEDSDSDDFVADIRDKVAFIDVPNVQPGDVVIFQLWGYHKTSGAGTLWGSSFQARFGEFPDIKQSFFETFQFKKTVGSIVDLKKHEGFRQHLFLDLLRGIVDEFNLTIQTDTVNKIVKMEPTFDYYTGVDPSATIGGYFTSNRIDWSGKIDLSKDVSLELFSDFDRVVSFKKKSDGNNGGVKSLEDANSFIAGQANFTFNNRFKSGDSVTENRFFAETVHVKMEAWRDLYDSTSLEIPQIIALIPENVANTSNEVGENTFTPISAYYKGQGSTIGNSKFKFDGDIYDCPSMFTVNYNNKGELDPVLTYSDQLIGSTFTKGLLRKFYLNRLAMMQSGKRMRASFFLENKDVVNPFHTSKITIGSSDYYLFGYNNYLPLRAESTDCFLWKSDMPKNGIDSNIYPSQSSISTGLKLNSDDTNYAQLLILQSELTIQE